MTTPTVDGGTTPTDGLDAETLSAHLRAVGLMQGGTLTARLVSGGKSNLTYLVTDGIERWVLRRPPLGHVERGAHDVSREFRAMSGLAETGVPVPRPRLLCEDPDVIGAPFYVMDEVDGVVLRERDQVRALGAKERSAVATSLTDTLALLHDVDVASGPLSELGRPQGYLERQLGRWTRQFAAVTSRDLTVAKETAANLAETMPVSPSVTVVHGDYRIDNVMVCPDGSGRIAAVLDWEMATLGDPLADLGMLAMFWDEPHRPYNPISGGLTAFDGFGGVDEMVERYAQRRGVAVDHLDWYLCFSEFKLAVILEQIVVRHALGETRGAGFDGIGGMVDDLLRSALSSSRTLR